MGDSQGRGAMDGIDASEQELERIAARIRSKLDQLTKVDLLRTPGFQNSADEDKELLDLLSQSLPIEARSLRMLATKAFLALSIAHRESEIFQILTTSLCIELLYYVADHQCLIGSSDAEPEKK